MDTSTLAEQVADDALRADLAGSLDAAVLQRASDWCADNGQPDVTEIDLDAVVSELHKLGHDSAYVEHTGGGVATLYVGPTVDVPGWGPTYAAVAGPGWFAGEGWTQGRAWIGEFYIGADDDDDTYATVTTSRPGMIAQAIAAQVRATIASR